MKTLRTILAVALLPLAAAAQTKSDPFTDSLREAVKQYQAGELDKAREALDRASAILDAKQAGKVADSFPDAPKGWTAEDVQREAVPDFLGGGKTVKKSYLEQGSRKEIVLEVITGSKFTGLIAGMGSNDAIAESQGYTVKRIGSDRALLKGSELLLPVDDKVLIKLTAKGGATEKDLMALAREVDRNALKRMK
jgi:hypothetical protein